MTEISNVEMCYHLDQFMWEEEIIEIQRGVVGVEDRNEVDVLENLVLAANLEESMEICDLLKSVWFCVCRGIIHETSVHAMCDSIRGFVNVLCLWNFEVCLLRNLSKFLLCEFGPVRSLGIRVCLNLLYVMRLCGVCLDSAVFVRVFSDFENLPVCKLLLLLFLCLSPPKVYVLPPNTVQLAENPSSPLVTLLNSFPLSLPALSDFRSFVLLAEHQYSLLRWTPPAGTPVFPRPAAIDEAIAIADKYLCEFALTYRFHDTEIEVLKGQEFAARPLKILMQTAKTKNRPRMRSNLLRPPSQRFHVSEIARHMIPNYQLAREDVTDNSVLNEAYESASSWLGSDEEVIEAIADAVVADHPHETHETHETQAQDTHDTNAHETHETHAHDSHDNAQADVGLLLKHLLASCRAVSCDERDKLGASLGVVPGRPDWDICSCVILGLLESGWDAACEKALVGNNGCLVLLKIITTFGVSSGEYGGILPQIQNNTSWRMGMPDCRSYIVYRSLLLLYRICHQNSTRIKKYLIHYKVATVLKKYLQWPNVGIQKIAYKLFKIQISFLSKKWKYMHIKQISCCFAAVATEPMDDWLTSDPPDDEEEPPAAPIVETPKTYAEDFQRLDLSKKEQILSFCKQHNEKNFFAGFENIEQFSTYGIGL